MDEKTVIETRVIKTEPKYLWFLTLAYSMVIVLANWFDPRLIRIFFFDTDAGTIIFPLTFLLSDLITEVYGYKHARRAIWCGFLFNILFIVYGQIIIHLPSPEYPTNNAAFDQLLTMNIRIIFASLISYFCSEPFNSYVMAKLKIKMHGHYMGIRFLISTIVASATDSFIFGALAFYGIMSNSHLVSLILTMWLLKVFIEILGLPISIRTAIKLKKIEGLDIYDKATDFNILKLDAEYPENANEYKP